METLCRQGPRGALREAIPRGAACHLGAAPESGFRSQICTILTWDGLGASSTIAVMSVLRLSGVPAARPVSPALRCWRAPPPPRLCLAPWTPQVQPSQHRGALVPVQPRPVSAPKLTTWPVEPAVKRTRGTRRPRPGTLAGEELGERVPAGHLGHRMARGQEKGSVSIRSDLGNSWAGMPSSSLWEVGARMGVLAVALWGRLWRGREGSEV